MKVLSNADEVIDLLSKEGPLTPAEIAEKIGLPRPSVYRLLDGLHAIGLTEPSADSAARLSLRWLHLADQARTAMHEWAAAPQVLSDLVARTGQTAYLSVQRQDEAVCVHWEQGRGIGVLLLKPGRSLPLHAGAAGRALLAFSDTAQAYILQPGKQRYTSSTLVDAAQLQDDILATRARGYSVSDEDVTEGIGALGTVVRSPSGTVMGALSIAGLAEDVRTHEHDFAAALLASADSLSAAP